MEVVWGSFVGTPVSEELSFLRKKVKLYIYVEREGGCAELPDSLSVSPG